MLDFITISTRSTKQGVIEVYPKFIIKKSSDLMIRGGDFYAIWVEDIKLWSTDEQDVIQLIDRELDKFVEENKQRFGSSVKVLHMWDAETGVIDSWHKYCQKQMRDQFHMLDEKLIFSNVETKKRDYASKRLTYPLENGDITAYEKLMSTLYDPDERHKIEWAIGAVVNGDSKKLQKFLVLYGAAGTGKSTILNLVQQLFEGYYSTFSSKALGSASNSFALEDFKTNPLVSIEHDGDLSRIEDNTKLNSLVSHELMSVNEKFKSTYSNRFKSFLFIGTNKPVKITEAKSGLMRRLIDVVPSGRKLESKEYKQVVKQLEFELGAIATHCEEVYSADPAFYDDYIPKGMIGASNDFYNFVEDSYFVFKRDNGVTLKSAWEMYKTYCDEAKVPYPMAKRTFKEELRNYFWNYEERYTDSEGNRYRSYFSDFRADRFESESTDEEKKEEAPVTSWIELKEQKSIFDSECADCPAQYATDAGTPTKKWENTKTKLSDMVTSKLHYVSLPESHIVVDFDLTDEKGEKSYEENLKAASAFPPTYAELSKSGAGIHLHYIYSGDVNALSRIYSDHIEVKVFAGNSSLRRKLTKCNDLPIATISSGLPLKGEKLVNFDAVKSEKGLRTIIKRNLCKEIHPGTKPSIDFINKILTDAYNSGMFYDVTDMRNAVLAFAASSTHQADYCIKLVNKMPFKSEDVSVAVRNDEKPIVFYDVEVFPNLFLVNYKIQGPGHSVVRMINPTPADIEELLQFRLVGFNCRRYDNHIMYARLMGYTNEQLYNLSQKIINGSKNCFFGEAYNLSYTDVYDFASAGNKKSLKKFEIELGIHHQELGLPWDEPVPEELWPKVAEYCDNDVIATEATFDHLSADWTARQILADLAGMTVNDTTNTLTTKIIFGENKHPQDQFRWRDMSQPVHKLPPDVQSFLEEACPEMMKEPHGEAKSLLPYFPGYKFDHGKSTYRDVEVGEGGYAKGEPGMYGLVALLDVTGMHPHSAIAEVIFGVEFTRRFKEIVDGRVDIKHEAWSEVNQILGGKLTPYVQRVIDGEMTAGDLANGLKTAVNSVYGLTSASFENAARDPNNVDNIVAKRGALFMLDLKYEVEKRGFIAAHIKTDSIKIPDATPEIIQFVMDFGKRYGYTFEHEATYDRMCLVNDAVYIAKYATAEKCQEMYGYVPGDNKKHPGEWTATGKQFQVPYVFKSLFSKEDIVFEDMCEVMSVTTALYLDMNEELLKSGKDLPFDEDGKAREIGYDGLPIESHSYHFIGKVGQFCPIKEGCGGGLLVREKAGKYNSATGAKGYRWLESEMVKQLGKEGDIDRSYYNRMVDAAAQTIIAYGDLEWFTSDDPYIPPEHDSNGTPIYPSCDDSVPFN